MERAILNAKVAGMVTKPDVVDIDEQASKIVGKKKDLFIVAERGKFVGMVLEEALLAAPPSEKARTLAFKPPSILPGATVLDAMGVFVSSGLQEMPVVDRKGILVGSLGLSQLMAKLDFSDIPLEEVINRHPYVVDEAAYVSDVREVMFKGKISRVYVTDRSGNLTGLATHGCFLKRPTFFKKDWRRISEVMERDLISISTSDSVKRAVSLICRHDMRSVAVVEDGKLLGSVGARDILRASLKRVQPGGEGIAVEVVGLGGLESFQRAAINAFIFQHIGKLAKSIGPGKVKIGFKQIASGWEIILSLRPRHGKAVSVSKSDFDAFSAASQVLRTLERRVRHD